MDWLADYGDPLFAYALASVRCRATAEDLVQATFLAAIESANRFEARSEVLTWLTGILRHKIADHFRRRTRESVGAGGSFSELEAAGGETTFDAGRSRTIAGPVESASERELGAAIQDCIGQLPAALRVAFFFDSVRTSFRRDHLAVNGVFDASRHRDR